MSIITSSTTGPSYTTDPTASTVGRSLLAEPIAGLAAERREQIARLVRAERLAAALPAAPSSPLRRAIACALVNVAHRLAADV